RRRPGRRGVLVRLPAQARAALAHGPEKWAPVFGSDHAQKVGEGGSPALSSPPENHWGGRHGETAAPLSLSRRDGKAHRPLQGPERLRRRTAGQQNARLRAY